jgi:5-(carboxyamino)imidazole ribonucleotide synthase
MKSRGSSKLIPPESTLGMLGGGQLGRMALLAGRRLGYRFHVYDPAADCCAAPVAEKSFTAPWSDQHALAAFAQGIAAATLEFENIPVEALETVERHVAVRPGARVLGICQHRRREKEFLRRHGFPCAPFALAESAAGLEKAIGNVGYPCVLKTAAFGYDGKGQMKLKDAPKGGAAAWADLWRGLGAQPLVVEKWIPFEVECSVIVARGAGGATAVYPMAENEHRHHILHRSIAPARLSARLQREGAALARELAESLEVVGLLAVELFCVGGKLLVNELAPRPHNSGHYTFDACVTSQFEQQIRCTTGLPLGATDLLRPAVMINLLGDLWRGGKSPDWSRLLRDPRVKLHLYDKGEPRPSRKMGHFTVLDENPKAALKLADKLFDELATV